MLSTTLKLVMSRQGEMLEVRLLAWIVDMNHTDARRLALCQLQHVCHAKQALPTGQCMPH